MKENTMLTKKKDEKMLELLSDSESLVGYQEKLLLRAGMAIQTSRYQDWVDFEGHPHPLNHVIARIAGFIGASFQEPKIVKEDLGEGHYMYVSTQTVSLTLPNGEKREASDIGTAHSRQPFFCKRQGKILKPQEIDPANIVKKAVTNGRYRAIALLIGLKALTRADLEKLGIKKGDIQKIPFKTESKKETPILITNINEDAKSSTKKEVKDNLESQRVKALFEKARMNGIPPAAIQQFSVDQFGKDKSTSWTSEELEKIEAKIDELILSGRREKEDELQADQVMIEEEEYIKS